MNVGRTRGTVGELAVGCSACDWLVIPNMAMPYLPYFLRWALSFLSNQRAIFCFVGMIPVGELANGRSASGWRETAVVVAHNHGGGTFAKEHPGLTCQSKDGKYGEY